MNSSVAVVLVSCIKVINNTRWSRIGYRCVSLTTMSWCWSRSSSTACSSVHVRVSIERISLHSPVTGQMEIHRLTATEGACSMTKRASAGMQYCYDVPLMCSVYVATRCRSVAHYTAERNVVNSTSVYWHASLYDSCYSSMLLLLLLLLPMLFSIQVIAERERESRSASTAGIHRQ